MTDLPRTLRFDRESLERRAVELRDRPTSCAERGVNATRDELADRADANDLASVDVTLHEELTLRAARDDERAVGHRSRQHGEEHDRRLGGGERGLALDALADLVDATAERSHAQLRG